MSANGSGSRAIAARVVTAVAHSGESLDRALAEQLQTELAQSVSTGLVRLLSYEALRWYLRLDALLRRFIKPSQDLRPEVRSLALVGLTQLFHTDIPAYAAVSATVEATRLIGQPKAAGLINAVLRRAQREGASTLQEIDRDIARRSAHPPWLVQRLRQDWPGNWEAILEANNAHPPFWLRVNRQRQRREEYQQKLTAAGIASDASSIAPDALYLPQAHDLESLPGFLAGDVSVQDVAAQLAVEFLRPGPGERVLDACAAPGGKACHVLEREPQLNELVAVDISPGRLRRVRQNLDRLCLSAQLVVGDVAHPQQWWDGRTFDRILLDVPCSATGVIRRHPDIKLLRRESDIAGLAARQSALLRAIWPLLRAGGLLVYASCSALQAENAAVIGQFLQDAAADDITAERAQSLGLPVAPAPGHAIAAGTAGMDGFYYACLQKT